MNQLSLTGEYGLGLQWSVWLSPDSWSPSQSGWEADRLASMNREPSTHRPGYCSYLIRLWRVSAEGSPAWRVSLQQPGSAVVMGFASLEELCSFLREEIGEQEGGVPDDGNETQAVD
jgi:hypothetical protein